MANVCDYVKWRGDITLEQSKFNEIDNLILSRFSYFPFDKIIKENEVVTIKELSERFKKQDIRKLPILWKDDVDLFPLMGESKRYGEMNATKYVNKIDVEQEKQFSAITIELPDNTIFVSYRGTDNTIVGWKEDFNLSFMINIPAQIEGLKYVEKIASKYPNKMHLGGHSKGGNVAVYSAIFAKKEIQNRIIDVTNHDGPGFDKSIIERGEYKRVLNKIFTYIPQSSIIGRLLEHEEKYKIVKSIQKGIMQHDIYSWQVLGTKFVKLNEVTNGSEIINETVRTWLKNTTIEQRENFINIIYEIISATNAKTLKEISLSKLKNMRSYIKIV